MLKSSRQTSRGREETLRSSNDVGLLETYLQTCQLIFVHNNNEDKLQGVYWAVDCSINNLRLNVNKNRLDY